MRRWLARLSFSFLILAFALAYTAWQRAQYQPPPPQGRQWLSYGLAGICVVLALLGTRERHRGD